MSTTSKEVRLYLLPEDWAILDRVCIEKEWSRGRMAAQIVRAWCAERRALDQAQAAEEDRIDALAGEYRKVEA